MTTAEITFYSGWYCPFAQRSWTALEHLAIAIGRLDDCLEYRQIFTT